MKTRISIGAIFAFVSIFGVPISVEAQEQGWHAFETVLERVKQNCHPLKTLSLEFTEERAEKGKPLALNQVFKVKIDVEKTKAFIHGIRVVGGDNMVEWQRTLYINNGVVTETGKSCLKGDLNYRNERAIIRKQKRELPSEVEVLLSYNSLAGPHVGSFKPSVPMFINGRLPFLKPTLSNIDYKGEPSLQILAAVNEKEDSDKECFIFSKKNGFLLERKSFEYVKKDGKIVEEVLYCQIFSDYFLNNGVFFPSTLTFPNRDGSMRRIKVKKETARINELIDEKEFIPKIPGGSPVRDEIRGIEYTTPIVGNLEAERALGKALDAYLEEADKVTKPK